MPFVYHYHATKQVPPLGKEFHIDGLVFMKDPVVDMESYHEVKDLIVADQGFGSRDGLTITGLSFLHKTGKSDNWDGFPG